MTHPAKPPALIRFLASIAVLTLLASATLYAQFNAGYYSSEPSGSIRQADVPSFPSGAMYDTEAYPLFPQSLPPGVGVQEVQAYCNTCHSVRYITMQPPLPPDAWVAEVNKMTKTYGASIPDDALQRIVQYLQSNFCVGNRKK